MTSNETKYRQSYRPVAKIRPLSHRREICENKNITYCIKHQRDCELIKGQCKPRRPRVSIKPKRKTQKSINLHTLLNKSSNLRTNNVNNSIELENNKKVYFYDDSDNNKPSPENLAPDGPIKFIQLDKGNLDCKNTPSIYHDDEHGLKINYNERIGNIYPFSRKLSEDCGEENNYGENLFLGSGLRKEHFTQIKEDVDKKLISCLVFDWDRTITLIEGILLGIIELLSPKKGEVLRDSLSQWKSTNLFKNKDKWNKKEFAKYFLHDPEYPDRIDDMRDSFTYAQKKGVPIFILTANRIPKGGKKNVFVDIFDAIGIKINEDCVFGGDSSRKIYEKNKEEVILQNIMGNNKKKIKEQATLQLEAYTETTSRESRKYTFKASGKKKKRKTKKTRKNRKSKTPIKKRRKKTKK